MANLIPTTQFAVGERKSFYGLFATDGYSIKIPRMQRDYAQGRKSSFDVRDAFLDTLHEYLERAEPNRDLDFVYGSLSAEGDKRLFVPLDGQQRLTTLFLLHWYLAWTSDRSEDFNEVLLKDGHSRFTYETRPSSGNFCDSLLAKTSPYVKLLEDEESNISTFIQKLSWFRRSWMNDPTVASMLTMLDAIHVHFQGKCAYYDRLVDLDKPVITFFLLDLKDSRLMDDLYIKMNARGKPLTPFEVFKAQLEKMMPKMAWPENAEYTLERDGKKTILSPRAYFSLKIDTAWADLFWQYRDMEKNIFDTEIMIFIRLMFTFRYLSAFTAQDKVEEREAAERAREELLGTQVAQQYNPQQPLTYRHLEKLNAVNAQSVILLINALDALGNGMDKICRQVSVNYTFYFDEEKAFKGVLNKPGHQDRVLFYAYIMFLINRQGVRDGLDEWMRVIHNLAKNSPIDGADEVTRAIKSVDKLLPHCNSILHFLSGSTPDAVDFFYSGQCLEELIKSHLILLPDNAGLAWGKAIRKAEQNPYFAGQIGFLLDFCGLIEAYEKGALEQTASAALPRFIKYTEKVYAVFPRPENDRRFAWERAVLSKGDYPLGDHYGRRNFLSKPGTKARDYSWKRFFRLPQVRDKNEDKATWTARRSYAQAVFDDQKFNANKAEASLELLCSPTQGDWRDIVIINPGIINYCDQGFFLQKNSENRKNEPIYLYKHSRISHTHAELFSYDFFLSELQKNQFAPFEDNPWYYGSTSEEELPCAVLSGCHIKKKKFELDIFGRSKDSGTKYFSLEFIRSDDNTKKVDFPQALQVSLENLNYTWVGDGYRLEKLSQKGTVKAITALCKVLLTWSDKAV